MRNSEYKICLLNGPPKCGKDTIASHLVPYLNFTSMKFASPIKRMVATLLDMSVSTLEQHKDNEFNILSKEEIHETEFGTKITYGPKETPRKLLIRLSEEFLKPTYGPTYFGRLAAREVGRSSNSLIIFTDCGFTTECNTLIGQYGRANTLLCRLHRDGCNFENDSRSYLPDIAGANYDIQNNGSIAVGTAIVARRIRDTFGIALNKEIEI